MQFSHFSSTPAGWTCHFCTSYTAGWFSRFSPAEQAGQKQRKGGQWDGGALMWKMVRSECPWQYGQMTKAGEMSSFTFSASSWILEPQAHAIFAMNSYSNFASGSWKFKFTFNLWSLEKAIFSLASTIARRCGGSDWLCLFCLAMNVSNEDTTVWVNQSSEYSITFNM